MLLAILVGCQGGTDSLFPKEERPIAEKTIKAMKAKGMTARSPILLRIFKEESTLEVWKRKDTGLFALLETYDICKWSGKLGPKFKEGDRQAPEGFYTVAPAQMNPGSSYHLSFNMGFPNKFDRAHGRTGTHLMVHGACSSAGCYSMTDEFVEQIYALARESFKGGQRKFQIQAYPFRMTPKNMVRHKDSKHYEFWKTLKKGNDYFIVAQRPPKVDVCDKNYVFNREVEDGVRFNSKAACPKSTIPPRLEQAYLAKFNADNLEMAKLIEKADKKERRSKLLNGKKKTDQNEVQANQEIVAANPSTAQSGELAAQNQSESANPTRDSSIPIARPASDAEIAAKPKKKRQGLFSWLKSD